MKGTVALSLATVLAVPAAAAEPAPPSQQAAGFEFFYSSDSDHTEIVRTAIDFDLRHHGEDRYFGVRLEKAWYDPAGTGSETRERLFVRVADTFGNWQWRARVGTDGNSIIGAASINDRADFRKELFIERDVVETRQGLDRGIYSTFAGAAIDLPADDRNVFTALVGLQAFTGDNTRVHVRSTYIHVVRPEWGLSVQLRGRYFRSSDPGEFDYYSPRWYAEILPVVQLRRFVGGWELRGAGGIGMQRDSASDWRQSRYFSARFRSPSGSGWALQGDLTYTNTPSVTAVANQGYSYMQASLGLSRRF